MVIKAPKKLIEVALPLDDINEAAAREKSIRHGHPSTLHLWWARRPLAAARAVLFAQMVNDPGGERGYKAGMTKEQAQVEREKLFDIIRDLVKWENTNNPEVLERARAAIRKSWRETCELNKGKPGFDPDVLPAFHDPFAGGGAIPLEAQRLGLESYASDLNPVAVLINKAMIEIPPKFAGRAPVGPLPPGEQRQGSLAEDWSGAKGLAEDVRRYGAWMREEAFKRIGHLYPKVDIKTGLPVKHGEEQPGQETATVIAWIWARTVKSPNPAYSHVEVPLVSTFVLSAKPGQEAWLEPVVDGESYAFSVRAGKPVNPEVTKDGTKVARGSFRCLLSGSPIPYEYVDSEATGGRLGTRLLAVVAEVGRKRVYVSATQQMEDAARQAVPSWKPEAPCRGTFASNAQGRRYGFMTFGDYFTNRQAVTLATLSDLVMEVRKWVASHSNDHGGTAEFAGLEAGGTGVTAYADAIATYLSLAVSKAADYNSSLVAWSPTRDQAKTTFARQGIAMVWDYAEVNPFAAAAGDVMVSLSGMVQALRGLGGSDMGGATQADAQRQAISRDKVVSTDPPYYNNIAYGDLSDFFYVWLRRSLRQVYPSLFATMVVPKNEELVASPYRHDTEEAAEQFFMDGMTHAMTNLAGGAHAVYPVTIYYALKQSDTSDEGTASTGWATFLEAVIRAGFSITGTWPMRTERAARSVSLEANALASSIVLVCRKREADAPTISRREFIRELKEVLPVALSEMTAGSHGRSPVAAVDLAQAIIGPGMAVFSKYAAVLEADGSPMTVHTALTLINTYLPGDPDEFDADTRFCLTWFEENGWLAGQYGQANVLARAKGTSVEHVADAGVVESGQGKVRLLKSQEYPADWKPETDKNTPVWEATHQIIRGLQVGEKVAGALLSRMPDQGDKMRQLAYRLYTLCERKGWAEEARAYNELINSWSGIEHAATTVGREGVQTKFDF